MDFAKSFDKEPHERLLYKLYFYGIRGSTHKWIDSWLSYPGMLCSTLLYIGKFYAPCSLQNFPGQLKLYFINGCSW